MDCPGRRRPPQLEELRCCLRALPVVRYLEAAPRAPVRGATRGSRHCCRRSHGRRLRRATAVLGRTLRSVLTLTYRARELDVAADWLRGRYNLSNGFAEIV